ncbi:unnamed protein product [Allacma fusca]|uniref:Uncharacterized protein n=1 Tax=Allacma fusca TaxID=39272 RepID=A0A8J2KKI1_9HEXA|nr:unnamed protein product [Allacma fusca]
MMSPYLANNHAQLRGILILEQQRGLVLESERKSEDFHLGVFHVRQILRDSIRGRQEPHRCTFREYIDTQPISTSALYISVPRERGGDRYLRLILLLSPLFISI